MRSLAFFLAKEVVDGIVYNEIIFRIWDEIHYLLECNTLSSIRKYFSNKIICSTKFFEVTYWLKLGISLFYYEN